MQNKIISLFSAVLIGAGILGAGFFIGKGFYYGKFANRTITVKGLAERDVKSDLGIWEINYREVGSNLVDLNQRIQQDQTQVKTFLKQRGFVDKEFEIQSVKVEDRLANVYSQTNATTSSQTDRYVITSGMRVRTERVELIQQAVEQTSALLQLGVSITFESSMINPNPSFYLIKLDAIRPLMLADATRSARTIAEQFAKDAGVELRSIQRANQGVFQIMSRDTSTMSADWSTNQSALGSIDKKVRLVTTIDYQLK